MTRTVYQIDPEIDHLVVMNRDGAGRRRIVAEVDANMSEPSRKTYKVRVVERNVAGGARILEVPSRKKQSRLLRPLEKLTRKSARSTIRFMQDYLYLHDRSNKKSKDGWIRNYTKNLRKAARRRDD
ncbi:MAG TPA: hypothetical protein VLQ65_10900 [Saliniramus sp.]|nr:hypothetical protein [Saliniramus sp.]